MLCVWYEHLFSRRHKHTQKISYHTIGRKMLSAWHGRDGPHPHITPVWIVRTRQIRNNGAHMVCHSFSRHHTRLSRHKKWKTWRIHENVAGLDSVSVGATVGANKGPGRNEVGGWMGAVYLYRQGFLRCELSALGCVRLSAQHET